MREPESSTSGMMPLGPSLAGASVRKFSSFKPTENAVAGEEYAPVMNALRAVQPDASIDIVPLMPAPMQQINTAKYPSAQVCRFSCFIAFLALF